MRAILTINYKRIPRLSCFLLGLLCSLVVTVPALEYRSAVLREQQNQDYGVALARMGAQQAVDAALNHDLVSLQVILQDVVANPRVLLATIHDVENNLLVQADDARLVKSGDLATDSHTAPITLHDSVAGYLTVTLEAEGGLDFTVILLLIALALLLLIATGAPLYERRQEIFLWRPRSRSTEAEDDNGFTGQGETRPATTDSEPEDAGSMGGDVSTHESTESTYENTHTSAYETPYESAYAELYVLNTPHLRNQLSINMFEQLGEAYYSLLQKVLPLYNGHLMKWDAEEQVISFTGADSAAEAAFQAACSVYLITRLAGSLAPFPLQLAAVIGLHDEASDSEAVSSEGGIYQPGLWLTAAAAGEPLLQNRLHIGTASEVTDSLPRDVYQVMAFEQPYRALLEKQCQQLASQF